MGSTRGLIYGAIILHLVSCLSATIHQDQPPQQQLEQNQPGQEQNSQDQTKQIQRQRQRGGHRRHHRHELENDADYQVSGKTSGRGHRIPDSVQEETGDRRGSQQKTQRGGRKNKEASEQSHRNPEQEARAKAHYLKLKKKMRAVKEYLALLNKKHDGKKSGMASSEENHGLNASTTKGNHYQPDNRFWYDRRWQHPDNPDSSNPKPATEPNGGEVTTGSSNQDSSKESTSEASHREGSGEATTDVPNRDSSRESTTQFHFRDASAESNTKSHSGESSHESTTELSHRDASAESTTIESPQGDSSLELNSKSQNRDSSSKEASTKSSGELSAESSTHSPYRDTSPESNENQTRGTAGSLFRESSQESVHPWSDESNESASLESRGGEEPDTDSGLPDKDVGLIAKKTSIFSYTKNVSSEVKGVGTPGSTGVKLDLSATQTGVQTTRVSIQAGRPSFSFNDIVSKFKEYKDKLRALVTEIIPTCPDVHMMKLVKAWATTFKNAWPNFKAMFDLSIKYAEDLKLQLALCLDQILHKKFDFDHPSVAKPEDSSERQKVKRELAISRDQFISNFNSELANPLVNMFAEMPEMIHNAKSSK